jgi:hypothetical protein
MLDIVRVSHSYNLIPVDSEEEVVRDHSCKSWNWYSTQEAADAAGGKQ